MTWITSNSIRAVLSSIPLILVVTMSPDAHATLRWLSWEGPMFNDESVKANGGPGGGAFLSGDEFTSFDSLRISALVDDVVLGPAALDGFEVFTPRALRMSVGKQRLNSRNANVFGEGEFLRETRNGESYLYWEFALGDGNKVFYTEFEGSCTDGGLFIDINTPDSFVMTASNLNGVCPDTPESTAEYYAQVRRINETWPWRVDGPGPLIPLSLGLLAIGLVTRTRT